MSGSSGSGAPPPPGGDRKTALTVAWIGAGALVIAAVIGLVATLLSSHGGSGQSAPSNPPSPSPATSESGVSTGSSGSQRMTGAAMRETAGGETQTHSVYTNAGGTSGETIRTGQTVSMVCRVQGFAVADGNVWWYRIADPPWSGNYYASADAFYNNGATSGPLAGSSPVDAAVPIC